MFSSRLGKLQTIAHIQRLVAQMIKLSFRRQSLISSCSAGRSVESLRWNNYFFRVLTFFRVSIRVVKADFLKAVREAVAKG